MAPKVKMAKSAKTLEKEKAEKESKASNNTNAARDKREQDARQLAASIVKTPGPPPFWILDSAAKLRDMQCKTYLREKAARKLEDEMEEAAAYVAFFGGALSSAIIGDVDDDVRCAAVAALGALRERAVPYTDALSSAVLKDKSAVVRGAAAKALGLCCRNLQITTADDMVKTVIGCPDQREVVEEQVIAEISAGFGCLTKKNQPLFKALIDAQNADVAPDVRKSTAAKLCQKALPDSAEEVIQAATKAFSIYLVEQLPALHSFDISILYNTDRSKLKKALDTLLPVAMDDPDGDVRQIATTTLSELKFSTEPMFAQLAGTLKQDESSVKRMRAADTFASFIRISDAMAAETFTAQGHALASAAMHDKVPGVRQAAALALGSSLNQAGPYVNDLAASLKDDDAQKRTGAARALGAIGEAAVPCLLTLFAAVLDDADFGVRYWASEAIGRMGDAAIPYISAFAVVALYDLDDLYRTRSNDALGAVGDLAGLIVDEWTVAGDEEENARQERAAKVLGTLGVPYQGLVIETKSTEKGRKSPQKGAPASGRGDKRRTGKQERSEAEQESVSASKKSISGSLKEPAKARFNTDFLCDVGKFLRKRSGKGSRTNSKTSRANSKGSSKCVGSEDETLAVETTKEPEPVAVES